MSYVQRYTVPITTDASGDGTGYTPVVNGAVIDIIYTKDTYATGVDFTVTTEQTTQTLWIEADVNASKTLAPRQKTQGTDGVDLLYAASGSNVEAPIYAADERIKIVVAQGGNATSGTFMVLVR